MKVPAPHNARQSDTIAIFTGSVMNRFRLYHTPSLQSFSQSAQISKAINSSTMSVCPPRLQRVAAYQIEAGEVKTLIRISHMRPRDVAEQVWFAPASGAGTCAPQLFERDETFAAILPLDCQFISYRLHIQRLHKPTYNRNRHSHKRQLLAIGYFAICHSLFASPGSAIAQYF